MHDTAFRDGQLPAEWRGLSGRSLDAVALMVAALLLLLGFRAVAAVVLA